MFLLKKMLERIFEKNCLIKDEQKMKKEVGKWVEELTEFYDIVGKFSEGEDSLFFLEQFSLALMIYRSGLRGVE
jgi:hypothetical protein